MVSFFKLFSMKDLQPPVAGPSGSSAMSAHHGNHNGKQSNPLNQSSRNNHGGLYLTPGFGLTGNGIHGLSPDSSDPQARTDYGESCSDCC
jgi:hypothetical protein